MTSCKPVVWIGQRASSYSEVARLLVECCGFALLSEDSIWRLVQHAAKRHIAEQEQMLQAPEKQSAESLPCPHFVAATEIYDGQAEEFFTLTQENARIF